MVVNSALLYWFIFSLQCPRCDSRRLPLVKTYDHLTCYNCISDNYLVILIPYDLIHPQVPFGHGLLNNTLCFHIMLKYHVRIIFTLLVINRWIFLFIYLLFFEWPRVWFMKKIDLFVNRFFFHRLVLAYTPVHKTFAFLLKMNYTYFSILNVVYMYYTFMYD